MRSFVTSAKDFNEALVGSSASSESFGIRAERIEPGAALLRIPRSSGVARSGMNDGPAVMTLIDLAMRAAMATIDTRGMDALASHCVINFLRRLPDSDVVADCRILNMNENFVGKVTVWSTIDDVDPLCMAACTYDIP